MGLFFGGLLLGLFCIFCAYKDYDWFMENCKARPLVALFGRNGARGFYIVLGAIIIITGFISLFAG